MQLIDMLWKRSLSLDTGIFYLWSVNLYKLLQFTSCERPMFILSLDVFLYLHQELKAIFLVCVQEFLKVIT